MSAIDVKPILAKLGVVIEQFEGSDIVARSPIDGRTLTTLRADSAGNVSEKIAIAQAAFLQWRNVPAQHVEVTAKGRIGSEMHPGLDHRLSVSLGGETVFDRLEDLKVGHGERRHVGSVQIREMDAGHD